MSVTWLITGRGIGYGLVKHLSADANNIIFASCRNPSKAEQLSSLVKESKAKIHMVQLDSDKQESIASATGEISKLIKDARLDYLINNAASHYGSSNALGITPEAFHKDMTTNVLGPALVTQALLPILKRSKTESSKSPVVVNMSSGVGSIAKQFGPISAVYSMSKTALNMLTYKQSAADSKVIFIAVNPGWVKTDMGGAHAQYGVEDSCKKIIDVVTAAKPKDSGHFKNHDGTELPW